MKKLTNDQKEQIIIFIYETGYLLMSETFAGVNVALEVLGYEDRVRFDKNKGVYKWSSVYDH